MEKQPKAVLLKFPGTNCEEETSRALREVGFETQVIHISTFEEKYFENAYLIVISGGFSYGDYVASGRFAKLILDQKSDNFFKLFIDKGGYILGICNGFQILTQLNLLPECSLIDNKSDKFQCEWVKLKKVSDSPFLSKLPDSFELPIAHAQGRFVTKEKELSKSYIDDGYACLVYDKDINGSYCNIAGIKDKTGHVFGLMPHPERFIFENDHYDLDWNQECNKNNDKPPGYLFFNSIYETIKFSN